MNRHKKKQCLEKRHRHINKLCFANSLRNSLTLWLILVGLIPFFSFAGSSYTLAQDNATFVRQRRTIEADDTGISNPAGLAFSSRANSFHVIERWRQGMHPPAITDIIKLKSFGGPVGSARITESIRDPINMVFDNKANRLLIFQYPANKLIDVLDSPDGNLDPTTLIRHNAKHFGLQNPQGMAVDPLSGHLFILDTVGPLMLRIEPEPDGEFANAVISEVDLRSTGLVDVRGIAFDPTTGHLHLLSISEQKLYELTQTGQVVATRDLSEFGLSDPQSMVFAPSGDLTDDPSELSLYIADSDHISTLQNQGGQLLKNSQSATSSTPGQIVELSFTEPVAPAASTFRSSLIQTIDAWQWSPPSPDSAGIVYLPTTDSLLVTDSEVNEMPIFTGDNLFEATLTGDLIRTLTTISFSDEPTGVTINPYNEHLFFSDDTGTRSIYELNPGPDRLYDTSDDIITSFPTGYFGGSDPEGITYANQQGVDILFIVDGVNSEVYRVDPGDNGIFDGVDDQVTSFDTAGLGLDDPEGIAFNSDNGNLYAVKNRSDILFEITTAGALVQTIDISAANARKTAGLAYAPSSTDPNVMSIYIVDRGVDNNSNPDENDGKVYEMTLPLAGNYPPIANDDIAITFVDATVTIDVAANDSDPEDNLDPASANTTCANGSTGCADPISGWLDNNGDGSFDYTPDPGFTGSDSFVYEICDTDLLCDTATVSITVDPVNDPPVANNDMDSTAEDTAVMIDVAANDSDPDDNLDQASANTTCTGCTEPSNGSLVNNGDGTFAYTPDPDFNGNDSFVYEICDTGLLCDTATVSITVNTVAPTTLEVRVAASSDDAEEKPSGSMKLTSSDLELTQDRANQQVVGMRFTGLNIPPGASIQNAYIQFQADETSTVATSLTIHGEAVDNATTFVDASGNISTRDTTDDSVPWSPVPWTTKGEAGPNQQTPDITAVIREIVNRPGWSIGNSLVIILTGTGKRTAEAFDGVPSAAPLLHIEYTTDNLFPTTSGIADVNVNVDAPDTVIDLFAAFDDFEDPDPALTYTIENNTNSALFTATPINGALGTLTLDYAPATLGTADITVRATDTGTPPLFVETTFTVTVLTSNNPPTTSGIADETVAEDAGDTVINLFAAFDDPDEPDSALTYTVESNTNSALFTATPINGVAGTLTLDYAPDANGTAILTVRATDNGVPVLSVDTAFTVTITEVNDAPILTSGSINNLSVVQNAPATPLGLTGLGYGPGGGGDENGQTLSYAVTTVPATLGDIVLADGVTVVTLNTYTLGQIQGMQFRPAPNVFGGPNPFQFTVTDNGTTNGVNDFQTVIETIQITVLENIPDPVTVEVRVAASSDDAEEKPSGSMKLTSSDLELTQDRANQQVVGMRFNGVNIPQGSTIVNAYAQFQADEINSGATYLIIEGEDSDNAATFVSTSGNITSRPRTSASAAWSPAPWTAVGEAGPAQQTSDLVSIIQEIVSRPGWASGNSLVIIISGSGKRVAEAYDGVSAAAPLLYVEYTASGNQIPAATISAPAHGSTYFEGYSINFTGTASDYEDGDLTASLAWESDLDGPIGNGGSFSRSDLSVGVHTVTATVTDVGGRTAFDIARITVFADTPVLVGAGDIADDGKGDEETAKLLENIPGTVYTLGDNAYPSGTDAEFNNYYDPTWGRHKARTRPAAGDNDYETPGALGYFNYFGTAAGDPDKGYYSYDVGDWHIIVLNSECTEVGGCDSASPQGLWLQADLAANPSTCTLAYWHTPLFTPGGSTNPEVKDFWSLLYQAGADVVLNGHVHAYERFALQDPNGVADPAHGIREFIVGTGGSSGVLKLTLNPTSYDWEFIPIAGQTFTDLGSALCVTPTSNWAPVVNDDSANTPEDTLVTIDVAANDSDPEGNLDLTSTNTTCAGCTEPSNGILVNNGDGTFAYTPNPDFNGADSFVYEICDTGPLCDTATVSITVNPSGTMTVEVRVAASTDDAEESAWGSIKRGSSDLELVFSGSDQTVGMRFNLIDIPKGATISNAYIQFQVDETNSGATSLTIEGEATDNATTFINSSGNISSRSTTASFVPWDPVAWTTVDEAGPAQRTPSISTIIQEIVDRPGWSSGNSIVLIITGMGERTAESFDGDSSAAPLLHVEYIIN